METGKAKLWLGVGDQHLPQEPGRKGKVGVCRDGGIREIVQSQVAGN